MNTWFRKIGMGATALTLAVVLGGCNNGDGGGGSRLLELFFGINGGGNCNSVVVEVDLDDADAVIARDGEGDPQCSLNTALANKGCNIDFDEPGSGILRATITGCTIPGVTNLFSCLFEDVDISDLQDTATGQCSCRQTPSGCDQTPPVCISEDPDPTSCEDCDNGRDDDGNGLIDCDDPNCSNNPVCGSTTTSTTSVTITTSTSLQTTTTSVSTTTSIPVEGTTCTVFLRLADDVNLGSLQFDVDYGDAPGEFAGSAGNVECKSLIQGALPAFNDKETQDILSVGMIALAGFQGPVNLADCTFTTNGSVLPQASDFSITVIEASDPDLNPVEPAPDVVVVSPIECEAIPVTTTIPIPTTTLEPPTTTTLPPSGNTYSVLFRLTSASANAGALQFHTDYSAAPGEFQGSAAAVVCESLIAGALPAFNDIDTGDNATLNLGIISLSPIVAPINLARCTFDATEGQVPVPANFPIVIDDATDPDGAGITATIEVTSVTLIP